MWTDEDLRNARVDGYHAYLHGVGPNDNPYNNNEEWELFCAWQEGWSAAAWDD